MMKIIKTITTLFLAVVFLISSLGFTINKMICLKNCNVEISLILDKDCCPPSKSSSPILNAPCCDINNFSFHLNDYNLSQKNNIPVADNCLLSINNRALTKENYNTLPSKLFFTDFPPLYYGRALLSFISILII